MASFKLELLMLYNSSAVSCKPAACMSTSFKRLINIGSHIPSSAFNEIGAAKRTAKMKPKIFLLI